MPISDFTTTLDLDDPLPITATQQIPWPSLNQDATIEALRAEVHRLNRARYAWQTLAALLAGTLTAVLAGVALEISGVAGEVAAWLGL